MMMTENRFGWQWSADGSFAMSAGGSLYGRDTFVGRWRSVNRATRALVARIVRVFI